LLLLISSEPLCAELEAGLGVAPLPTPENGPLAGYGGLFDRNATGIADPPEARALVLQSAEQTVAIVALDLVIIARDLRARIAEASQSRGIDTLVLLATHTHSGPGGFLPGFLSERVTAGRYDPDVPGLLADAAIEALGRALDDLAPARASAAAGELALAANRARPDGARETQLPVLRLDRSGGGPPLLLFAYGMHATVRSPKSTLYSADWVGAARAALRADGYRPLFAAGPLGDQIPTSELGELWPGDLALEQQQTQEVGRRVATAVADVAATLHPNGPAGLEVREDWVDLPDVRVRRFCALWWLGPLAGRSVRGFLGERVPIQVVRIGNAELIALPAEPTSALGSRLRAHVRNGRVPFVLAHANDWIGYAVTTEAYERGGYEPCLSFHGSDLGPWLVERAAEALGPAQ
jgi:hypothetical protein